MRITKRQLRKIIRESIEDEKCAIPGNMWKNRNDVDPATGVTLEQQYGDDVTNLELLRVLSSKFCQFGQS